MRRLGHPGGKKSAGQLQADGTGSVSGAYPLPAGTPGTASGAHVGIKEASPLTFIVMGDHGGVSDPNPQKAVAAALALETSARFIYSVGDLVYFNGDPAQYPVQFYEPYANLHLPIVGVPGNHDGDSSDGVTGSGIASFMANLCTPAPGLPPGDPDGEYGRDTQTQPYCDWTLALDAVTIIGLWSNVPSGGHLTASQVAYLTAQVKAANTTRPLIVVAHHPCYSVDAYHGGSVRMGSYLDGAFTAAGRWPDLVLAGHVHDYQRFTRTIPTGSVTYIVSGNGGYHNLHSIASDYQPGMQVASDVVVDYADASEYGYLVLTVDGTSISGEYVGVTPGSASNLPPTVTRGKDAFRI